MDNTINVEVVPVEIVRCPQCGARNRLLKQKSRVIYRCGGCATPLENPFALESIAGVRFQGVARRISSRFKYLVMVVVGIVVVIAVLRNIDEQPSREPSPPSQVLTMSSRPPPAPPKAPVGPPRSLENGTILTDLTTVGHGQFTIKNDTDRDAVVKLVDEATKHSVVAVYVTAHSATRIEDIPDRSFAALCGQGVDWDDNAGVFTRKKSFGKFDQSFDFTMKVERTEHQIIQRYQSITLEIAPTVDGNITQSDISEEAFLEY